MPHTEPNTCKFPSHSMLVISKMCPEQWWEHTQCPFLSTFPRVCCIISFLSILHYSIRFFFCFLLCTENKQWYWVSGWDWKFTILLKLQRSGFFYFACCRCSSKQIFLLDMLSALFTLLLFPFWLQRISAAATQIPKGRLTNCVLWCSKLDSKWFKATETGKNTTYLSDDGGENADDDTSLCGMNATNP